MSHADHRLPPRARTLGLGLFLVTMAFTTGCGTSHFAQGRVAIIETMDPIARPEPEIVASDTFFRNRDNYNKVAIYYMMKADTHIDALQSTLHEDSEQEVDAAVNAIATEFIESEDILELERTFIRNGFKVLEVRQLPKLQIEQDINASSDFVVFVQNFRDEEKHIGGGEIVKQAHFYHGTDATAIDQEMTPEDIDGLVGEKMSMADVVQQTKKIIAEGRSKNDLVQKQHCIFLDAKIVDVKTREVVLFYKSYTFSDDVKTSREKTVNEYTEETDKFKYDTKEKRFIAHHEVAKPDRTSQKPRKTDEDEAPYYGILSQRDSKVGDDVSVPKSDRLRRLAKACNRFIDTIKNYQADRSAPFGAATPTRDARPQVIYPYKAHAYIGSDPTPVPVDVLDSTDTHYHIRIASTGRTGKVKRDQITIERIDGDKR